MDSLTVLVVDDEPLARRRLTRLLARLDWVGRVEEAADAEAAVRVAARTPPDIVLLDIQLPGGDGFDALQRMRRPDVMPPAVVFVTAFDANAVDYVTKPIDPRRFEQAMTRARQAAGARNGDIWVRLRGECLRVAPEAILRFQAERDYVRIHVAGASYLHHESLLSLERRLDPAQFVRIHRGAIVRRAAVARFRREPFAAWVAVLTDGSEVRVGRTYAAKVRAGVDNF